MNDHEEKRRSSMIHELHTFPLRKMYLKKKIIYPCNFCKEWFEDCVTEKYTLAQSYALSNK